MNFYGNMFYLMTARCKATWIKDKCKIASDNVLIPYMSKFKVILATDASPFLDCLVCFLIECLVEMKDK